MMISRKTLGHGLAIAVRHPLIDFVKSFTPSFFMSVSVATAFLYFSADSALACSSTNGNVSTDAASNNLCLSPSTLAAGTSNSATGAVAIGSNATTTDGSGAVAIGLNVTAKSSISDKMTTSTRTGVDLVLPNSTTGILNRPSGTAIGRDSQVGPQGGVAIGSDNTAGTTIGMSVAIGGNNAATYANTMAIGVGNIASEDSAIAIGTINEATGGASIAIGRESYSSGLHSIAQGFLASAYGDSSIAIGARSVAGNVTIPAYGGIAIGDTSAALGDGSVTIGVSSTSYGISAIGIGAYNSSVGEGAVAAGYQDTSNGDGAFAGGLQNNASGNGSVAIGRGNYSLGQGAAALGNNSSAIGSGSLAFGDGATVARDGAIAFGSGAEAQGIGSVVIGHGAGDHGNGGSTVLGLRASIDPALGGSNVALGADSVASVGSMQSYNAFGLSQLQNSDGEVSIGSVGNERRITNIAAGSSDTDAVNVLQMRGALQNFGESTANAIGGSASYDAATGRISGQRFTIGGTSYNNITQALAALDTSVNQGGGTKYFHSNSQLVDSTASGVDALAAGGGSSASGVSGVALGRNAVSTGNNSVALGAGSNDDGLDNVVSVGNAGGERKVTHLAAGTIAAGSTDAVNGGQLYATGTTIASALGGGAAYEGATSTITAPAYEIGGQRYHTVGDAFAALDNSVNDGGGIKYFHASSSFVDSSATGSNSLAGGPAALASGAASVALGSQAVSSGKNSVALGSGSNDYGRSDVVSVGAVGAERRITNLADGVMSAGSHDAVNGGQLFQTRTEIDALRHATVRYDTATTGQTMSSVTLSSDEGRPVRIRNVGPAIEGNDAVNLAQLQQASATANSYTDDRIKDLRSFTNRQISSVQRDAAAGTASALAVAGLRYNDTPGKTAVTGAVSIYHGQAGLAFGFSHTDLDNRFKLNAAITMSPTLDKPEFGAVVGGSWILD